MKAATEKGIKRGRDDRTIERVGALCLSLHVTVRSLAKDECVLEQLLKGRYDCRDGNDVLAEHTNIYWSMDVKALKWRDTRRILFYACVDRCCSDRRYRCLPWPLSRK